MDPTDLALFDLADRRLGWLDRRQQVLAENIANADTPGRAARDLPSFAASLKTAMRPGMVKTAAAHMAGTADDLLAETEPRPSERAPDGNAVSVDEQLTKVADTETAQSLVTGIYKTYMTMFSLALGHSTS